MSKTDRVTAPPSRAVRATSKFRVSPIAYSRVLFDADAQSEGVFIETMRRQLAGAEIIPVGRARAGIYLLVKYALEKTGRRKVLLSPFTIPDVANMVILAGGEPVFFDSKPNSTKCDVDGLAALLDEQTACVLVTHYHVNETGISEIAALCRQNGALLFDDCAMAFGGKIGGTPVGVATDGGIFSFSSMKVLNFFWGGIVTTRNPEIAAWIRNIVNTWPRLALNAYSRQATTCIKFDLATRPTLFRHLVFPMLRKRTERNGASLAWMQRIESKYLDASLTSRPHFSAFAEWNRKFDQVDDWLDARRGIARLYHRQLGEFMTGSPVDEAEFGGILLRLLPRASCA